MSRGGGSNPRFACRDKYRRIELLRSYKEFLGENRFALRSFCEGLRELQVHEPGVAAIEAGAAEPGSDDRRFCYGVRGQRTLQALLRA